MGAGDLITKTIRQDNWDAGEEVVIRETTYGENLAMLDAATTRVDGEDILNNTEFAQLNLAKSVVSWTLTKDGKIMKLNDAGFKAIKGHVAFFIMEEIDAFTPKKDAEFRDEPGNGTQGQGDSTGDNATG